MVITKPRLELAPPSAKRVGQSAEGSGRNSSDRRNLGLRLECEKSIEVQYHTLDWYNHESRQ